MGVVFVRSTPEPTAAPTSAVGSEGGIEQCRLAQWLRVSLEFRSRRVQGGRFRHASSRKRHKERLPRGRTCEFTRTGRNTMWGRQNVAFTPTNATANATNVSVQIPENTRWSDEASRSKQRTKRPQTTRNETRGESANVREHAGRSAMPSHASHMGVACA